MSDIGARRLILPSLDLIPHTLPLLPTPLHHLINAEPEQLSSFSPRYRQVAFLTSVDRRLKGAPSARAFCFWFFSIPVQSISIAIQAILRHYAINPPRNPETSYGPHLP